jgi:hypothetical protein
MKPRRILPVTALIALAILTGSRGLAAPEIFVAETSQDFGTAFRDETPRISRTWEIQNIGDETLHIKKIDPSCGCTRAEITTYHIPAGEAATLSADLTFKHASGRERIRITLYTNDPATPVLDLFLSGELIRHWTLNPERLDLGVIPINTSIVRPFYLQSQTLEGVPTPHIVAVQSSHPGVVLEEGSEVVTPRQGYTDMVHDYRISVSAGDSIAHRVEAQVVFGTDQPERPVLVLPVTWTVEGDLKVEPRSLDLVRNRYVRSVERTAEPGDTRIVTGAQSVGKVTVSSATGAPFQILSVQAPSTYQILATTATSAPSHPIQVRLTGDNPGKHQDLLRILTDRPGEETLLVDLHAEVEAPAPFLATSPRSQSFGAVFADEVPAASAVFELRNEGSLDLKLELVSPKVGEATLSKDILAPGERAELILGRRLAGEKGRVEAAALVRSNDPVSLEKEFVLSGQVVSRWEFHPAEVDFKSVESGKLEKRMVLLRRHLHAWEKPAELAAFSARDLELKLLPEETAVACDTVGICTAETEIVVELTVPKQPGTHREEIDIRDWAPSPISPSPLTVAWESLGDLGTRPNRLVLAGMKSPTDRTVRLYSRSKEPFSVVRTEAPAGIEVNRLGESPGEVRFEVTITEQALLTPPQGRNLVFFTDRPSEPRVEVPILTSADLP